MVLNEKPVWFNIVDKLYIYLYSSFGDLYVETENSLQIEIRCHTRHSRVTYTSDIHKTTNR